MRCLSTPHCLSAALSLQPRSPCCATFWLKELIQSGALAEFCWIDTWGMTADGRTKGSIDRTALLQLAQGQIDRSYAPEVLMGKEPASVPDLSDEAEVIAHIFLPHQRPGQCVAMFAAFQPPPARLRTPCARFTEQSRTRPFNSGREPVRVV